MITKSQLYVYNKENYEVNKEFTKEQLDEYKVVDTDKVHWINFHGIEDKEFMDLSFKKFHIHRLTQNDIIKLNERPKIEEYQDYLFTTLKSIYRRNDQLIAEQISFVLTSNTLLSYQEKPGDIFHEIRYRISNNTGIVRKRSVDYLLYLLIDAVLQGYQKTLLYNQECIDELQISTKQRFSKELVNQIDEQKEQLKVLKKSIHPIRDQINKLVSSHNKLINEDNYPYFNDLRDQILFLMDEIDSERADLESLTNLYFAALSQKSNEIMQFLTIVSAIFIPLTFIAGVYGMNFKYIPELETNNGYFVVWGVMITIAATLVFYFKKRKWF